MNRAEIAAELRRSACEDASWRQIDDEAFFEAIEFMVDDEERLTGHSTIKIGTFYLLVAEAING